MIGTTQLIIILVIVLLLFGAKRLRNIGSDLGSAVKGFRSAVKDAEEEDNGEGKKIVLIGSMAALKGYAGSAGYCASKHGILGLGRTLAAELAQYNINVNIINPGGFDTNLRDTEIIKRAKAEGISLEEAVEQESKKTGPSGIPLGRLGKPEEIADLVFFLVSDQSKYITGEAILIGGGIT